MYLTLLCDKALRGLVAELNKQLAQSRSDLTAEKLVREDLECKIKLVTAILHCEVIVYNHIF